MNNLLLLSMLLFISVKGFPNINSPKTYEGFKAYQVKSDESERLDYLQKYFEKYEDIQHVHNNKQGSLYLVASHLVITFEALVDISGCSKDLVFENFADVIRADKINALKNNFTWNAYYDIDAITDYLHNMNEIYPEITEIIVAGKSYEDRTITGIRIQTDKEGSGKPAVIIESGIHAREWITPAATTYFINELLSSEDPEIRWLRDSFNWHIFPSVNPDGYQFTYLMDRMWRKTRSKSTAFCYGVDANRNWDHNWNTASSSSDPCDYSLYAGSVPFSEVETRSLANYTTHVTDLLAYIGLHSDAQMLLLPYSDSQEHCDNYDDLVTIGKASLGLGEKVNGEKYAGPATAAEILYAASGGSMDWVRATLGTRLVYTYELRGTFFHWPASRISEQGDELTQMMLGLFTEAENLGYF